MPGPALGIVAACVGLGLGISGVYFAVSALLFYWINRKVNDVKILQSNVASASGSVGIYLQWVLSAFWDAFVSIIVSAVNTSFQAGSLAVSYGIIIIGLMLALPPALIWTEYHPEIIELGLNVWQCGVVRFFYEFPLLKILNALRVVYNVGWPLLRVVVRFTRLFLRTIPILIFKCVGLRIFNILLYVMNFVIDLTKALFKWIFSSGSIITNPLNTTSAFKQLFLLQEPAMDFLVCGCGSLDFVWIILTDWVKHPATARLAGDVVELAAELFSLLTIRSIFGQNEGTVPGVTGPYYFMPNPNKVFDILVRIPRDLGDIINYEIFVLIKELVGQFDSSLFQPGDPETVVLASDWVGIFVSLAQAAIEWVRFLARLAVLALSFIIQGVVFLISVLFGSGVFIPAGPAVFCDIREWRAIFDLGGPSGLYFKTSGFFGALHRAVDNVENLLNLASPIAKDIVGPIFRIPVEILNFLGSVPLRLLFHLIDSEWRMFNPPIPPRVSMPLTFWVPAPSIPPPPVTCSANPRYPGYLLPWIQSYIDDPDGVHLRVISHWEQMAQGWYDAWSLVSIGWAQFFQSAILFVVYFYDVLIQTLTFVNVIIFESIANKAVFFSNWRYARLLNSAADIGQGINLLIRSFDPLDCLDLPAENRFFCLLGDIFLQSFELFKAIGYQVILTIITLFVPPLNIPNFDSAITRLENDIRDLIKLACLVIPPIPLSSPSDTLTTAFQTLLANAAPILVLPFRLINFILYKIGVLLTTASTVYGAITDFGTLVKDVITYFLQQLKITLGDGLLVGLGIFIDSFMGSDTMVFESLFTSIVDALATISNLVTTFALTLLRYVIALVASIIGLFFSDDNTTFDQRLLRFLTALKDLVLWTIFRAPLLLLQLIFGIISIILPPPLGEIVSTIGKLIVEGLCVVIQGFIDVVIGVANAFGADLTPIDLCCNGGSCVPTLRKRNEGPETRTPTDEIVQKLRDTAVEALKKTVMSNKEFPRRMERFRNVMEKHIAKKKRAQMEELGLHSDDGSSDYFAYNASNDSIDSSYFNPLLSGNLNNTDLFNNTVPVRMNIDEALALMADLVEWEGSSSCDLVVIGLTGQNSTYRKDFADMTLMEHVSLRDCVMRRTLGELLSVMPYFQWFPKDGFYNEMRWVQLPLDIMHAYSIFSQYRSDREMSRETVLSPVYIEGWKKAGLNTSHYKSELYLTFMNWTLAEYFEHNNGNIAIADAIIGYWHAVNNSVRDQFSYLQNLTEAVMSDAPSDIENWLTGVEAEERMLSPEIQQMHQMWRATLGILNATFTLVTGTTSAVYSSGVIGNSKRALFATPDLLKRGYSWYTDLDKNIEYQLAVQKRDLTIGPGVAHFKRTLEANAVTLRSAWNQLWDWAAGRLSVLKQKLTTPNSPRAKRNWRIIKHAFGEVIDAWYGQNATSLDPDAPPAGLTPSQTQKWHDRVLQVKAYNAQLNSTRSRRVRQRVATFATGLSVTLNNFTMITNNSMIIIPVETTAELQICNASLIPFCLNCILLDAPLAEAAISIEELIVYFNTSYGSPFNTSMIDFYRMNEYLEVNNSIHVCGGNGSSVIQWPSNGKVWGNNTFFQVFGGADGALISLGKFIISLFPSLDVLSTQSVATVTDRMAVISVAISRGLIGLINTGLQLKTSATTAFESSVSIMANASLNVSISENRIYDASATKQVDTSYLIFRILPFLRPLTLIFDTFSHFFTMVSITFTFEFDPITNSTTAVPVFDGSGELGFIGFVWTRFLAADYAYTCDRRNFSLLQGAIYTGLIYLLLGIVVSLTIGMISSTLAMLVFTVLSIIAPYVFFLITYNYPASNLFFLPVPLPPPCLADDAINTLVCDIVPKCPAAVAGMIDGVYSEETCFSCPTSLPVRHCKRQLLLADGIDWAILFIQWLFPAGIDFVATILGFGAKRSTIIGAFLSSSGVYARLTKFSNVDFTDQPTFDAHVSCLGVMTPAVIPGLGLMLIIGVIGFSVIVSSAVNILLRVALIPYVVALFANALFNAMVSEFVFTVTTADTIALQMALNPNADFARIQKSANVEGVTKSEKKSKGKKPPQGWFGSFMKSMVRAADIMGVEYYWKELTTKGGVKQQDIADIAKRLHSRHKNDTAFAIPLIARGDSTIRKRNTATVDPLQKY